MSGFGHSWLGDTLALYGRVLGRAGELTRRNPILAVAAIAYPMLLGVAASVVAPLGFAAGIALGLVLAAITSSWLALTGTAIRTGRVVWGDVPTSFAAYLGDVLTVGFLLMILRLVAMLVLAPFPPLAIIFGLATLVFFNAVPELIYLGRHAPAELLVASYRFIGDNWIEWFPLNLALLALVLAAGGLPAGPYGVVVAVAVGIVSAFGMLVRGLLFIELTTSSRRGRAFRRLAGS